MGGSRDSPEENFCPRFALLARVVTPRAQEGTSLLLQGPTRGPLQRVCEGQVQALGIARSC